MGGMYRSKLELAQEPDPESALPGSCPRHLLPPWPQVGAGACSCLSSGGFSFPGTERKASPQDPDLRDRQTALVCPRLKGRGRLIMNLSFLQIHGKRSECTGGARKAHAVPFTQPPAHSSIPPSTPHFSVLFTAHLSFSPLAYLYIDPSIH